MGLSKELQVLYKNLLRVAGDFKDPNFKSYFTRIIKDDFKTINASDSFQKTQEKNLEMLTRQQTIQNMYFSETFTTKR